MFLFVLQQVLGPLSQNTEYLKTSSTSHRFPMAYTLLTSYFFTVLSVFIILIIFQYICRPFMRLIYNF